MEYWNTGILDKDFFLTIIPSFHYSITPRTVISLDVKKNAFKRGAING